jgi:Flp pilus assembly secretin CpaC
VVKGRVLLEGEVASETYKRRIEKMVELYPAQVLNFTTFRESFVEGAKMVAVDIDFIQIASTNRDQLGVRWGQFLGANFTFGSGDVLLDYQAPAGGAGGGQTQAAIGPGVQPTDGQDPARLPFSALLTSGSGLQNYLSLVGNLNMTLDLLTENGLISTRQNGTIITEAGTEAEYQSGGTLLIEVPGFQAGAVIEKEYGLVFKVKPIVDVDDRVKLELSANYSELDFANGVGDLPALRKTEFVGTVNMQEGQSVLITGFSGEIATDNERGFWLVSQVPIVGWLFKGRNFQSQGTDNALFVTPRIYEPGGKTHRALVRGVFENLLQAGAEPTDLPNLSNAPTAAKPKSSTSKPASSDFE